MFEIVVEALRVVAAFSEGRGEGCVWRASKDLIFFFSARSESQREEAFLQIRRGMSTEMNWNESQDMEEAIKEGHIHIMVEIRILAISTASARCLYCCIAW